MSKKFVSPPREFKRLYGNELRQSTLENFFQASKKKIVTVSEKAPKKNLVQTTLENFFQASKKKIVIISKKAPKKNFVQSDVSKFFRK